jgi:hypothetical protein
MIASPWGRIVRRTGEEHGFGGDFAFDPVAVAVGDEDERAGEDPREERDVATPAGSKPATTPKE